MLSAMMKWSKISLVTPIEPEICPIAQAKALAYENAWHTWRLVLRIKPILAELTVLLAYGLV